MKKIFRMVRDDSKKTTDKVYKYVYDRCSEQTRNGLKIYTSIEGDKKDNIDVDTTWG